MLAAKLRPPAWLRGGSDERDSVGVWLELAFIVKLLCRTLEDFTLVTLARLVLVLDLW